ncbi:hypothetical protein CALCODRAFT_493246 [Calocera cornea HHB12733]|uniref:Uncharacterized protein n=1 Tax=Calocera cornea HHB12733 TaxID=1353952 RepID=A0A165HU01_9BASI|nr:hypothetical protein CALCODRAFT_493246 [Calocera cornea HHB12733]
MGTRPRSQTSPFSPELDTRSRGSPILTAPQSPSLDVGQPGESELVRQLRADLEVQKWMAESAMRAAADSQPTLDMPQSAESERQSLYQRLKELRLQLQREQEERQKQRNQADIAKEQSKAWVDSLQEKLKGLREEKKSWLAEAVELRSEVSELKKALDAQGKLLAQESARAFKLAAQRLEESPKFERVANFERRIDQLTAAQRLWANDIRKVHDLQEFVDLKENEFQRLGQVLRGRIHEINQLSTAVRDYEAEVADLKGKLRAAERAAASKALSPLALEYAAEIRMEMELMEKEMDQMREQNEELLRRNDEQGEMLHDLRMRLQNASTPVSASTPISANDSLRLPSNKGSVSPDNRSRRSSEGAGSSHGPHLSLQLSPAAAVPPLLSTPMLPTSSVIATGFTDLQDDKAVEGYNIV